MGKEKLITVKLTKKQIEVLKDMIDKEQEDRPVDLFTCDRCGKPTAFRSRQDAEKAYNNPAYRRKLGLCMCNEEKDK